MDRHRLMLLALFLGLALASLFWASAGANTGSAMATGLDKKAAPLLSLTTGAAISNSTASASTTKNMTTTKNATMAKNPATPKNQSVAINTTAAAKNGTSQDNTTTLKNATTAKNLTSPKNTSQTSVLPPFVRIASWNTQILGESKARNQSLMDFYAKKMKTYDLIIILEFREKNDTAFDELCKRLPGYECRISTRAGRSASKEQMGVFYNASRITLGGWQDFNPDQQDRWERPPLRISLNSSKLNFTLFAIHTDPDHVPRELNALEKLTNTTARQMAIGDFNADCAYYPAKNRTTWRAWTWGIGDGADTTVAPGNACAYDRIVLSPALSPRMQGVGIDRAGITAAISDHYLVWAQLGTK